jgi:tetratricopeptide (TPR) repeat protein
MKRQALGLFALLLVACGGQSGSLDIDKLMQSARAASSPAECVALYTKVLQARPTIVAAYVGRAECYLAAGDAAPALEDYSQAIRLSPGDPGLYLAHGDGEIELGNATAAASDYKKVVDISGAGASQLVRAAEGLGRIGLYQDALSLVDMGLKRYDNSWDLHRYRAQIQIAFGNNAEALREFGIAERLAAGGDLAEVLYERATYYLTRQTYKLALTDLNRAIPLRPNDYRVFRVRAEASRALGDFGQSRSDFGHAIGLYSAGGQDVDILADLLIERGRFYLEQGLATDALKDFQEALRVSRPTNLSQRSSIKSLIRAAGG